MKKALVTVLLLTAGAAFANEAADDRANRDAFAGERTRAVVHAEVAGARAAGTLNVDLYDANRNGQAVPSRRNRSDVRAEAVESSHRRVIHQLI